MQDCRKSLSSGHAEGFAQAQPVQQIEWNLGDSFGSCAVERLGQQGNEPPHRRRLARNIGVDVNAPVFYLGPKIDRGLALLHAVLALRLGRFESLRERRKLLGIVEESLQPGLPVGGLEPGNEGVQRRHNWNRYQQPTGEPTAGTQKPPFSPGPAGAACVPLPSDIRPTPRSGVPRDGRESPQRAGYWHRPAPPPEPLKVDRALPQLPDTIWSGPEEYGARLPRPAAGRQCLRRPAAAWFRSFLRARREPHRCTPSDRHYPAAGARRGTLGGAQSPARRDCFPAW